MDIESKKSFFSALKRQDIRSVRSILKAGLSPNIAGRNRVTGLHFCAKVGHAKLAALLLKAGAQVDARDEIGRTPLHFAAATGSFDVAKVLIESGADVNAKDLKGQSPAHLSCQYGRDDVILELLSSGASMDALDFQGMTPAEHAASRGKLSPLYLIAQAYASIDSVELISEEVLSYLDDGKRTIVESFREFIEYPLGMIGYANIDYIYAGRALRKATSRKNVVYVIFHEKDIVYIGSTVRGARRIVEHIDKVKEGKAQRLHKNGYWLCRNKDKWKDIYVCFFEVLDPNIELKEIEHRLISSIKPKLNVLGVDWVLS